MKPESITQNTRDKEFRFSITKDGFLVNDVPAERKKVNGAWYIIARFENEEVWLFDLKTIYQVDRRIPLKQKTE